MNYHNLTHDETAYLIFSFKKTLRDKDILPPDMVQFYESSLNILRKKLERLDSASDGRAEPPERYRFAKVRPTWYDVAIGRVPPDPSTDSGQVGDD